MSTTTREPIPVVPSTPIDPRALVAKTAAVQRTLEE